MPRPPDGGPGQKKGTFNISRRGNVECPLFGDPYNRHGRAATAFGLARGRPQTSSLGTPPLMDTDRDLLFGVLALRAGLLDAERFAVAVASVLASPPEAAPLADLLVRNEWLTAN